ncbi:hypothetical protein HPB50_010728 [Hyalomma asiaticum]|uniref:Uncharacterized protein n=1 Tax=Hyalomma asiaticum TaxID=266040 RepID=A0ACB7TI80_HYAAI|nr:hypothetical protein HPB50_010728 [Hyalomma asiaticum]
MTLDEDQAKDDGAPTRPRRTKRKAAAEEGEETSRQEAANVERSGERAATKTPSPTRMPSQQTATKPKRTTTRASSTSKKSHDVQPPDVDLDAPSTSKGLAQKAATARRILEVGAPQPAISTVPQPRYRSVGAGHGAAPPAAASAVAAAVLIRKAGIVEAQESPRVLAPEEKSRGTPGTQPPSAPPSVAAVADRGAAPRL